jgi:large subunit ribosomal protein L25
MIQVDMTASVRQDFGKGASRRLRSAGNTPAILYGQNSEPKALTMETKQLVKQLLKISGRNAVITLDVDGGKHHVMVKEIQTDPVRDTLVHTDFLEISLETPAIFTVPLNFVGTAKGVDMGGFLQVSKEGVLVKGLPLDIPDSIEVDITALELNSKGIICGDLNIPENITLLEDDAALCVSVVTPKRLAIETEGEELEEAEGAEGEAAAEAPAAG